MSELEWLLRSKPINVPKSEEPLRLENLLDRYKDFVRDTVSAIILALWVFVREFKAGVINKSNLIGQGELLSG